MPMKLCRLLLLFSIFVLQPVLALAAEEISFSQWAGTGELSVAVEGDGGTCPPTSHGHGVENPCSSIKIKGTDTPTNGSEYTVIGGVGEFTWSASGATMEKTGPRTATINVDGACGTGQVSVTGSCPNSATLPVRFSDGRWNLTSMDPYWCHPGSAEGTCSQPAPGCGGYFSRTVLSGGSKTVYYYKRTGGDCTWDYCAKCDVPKVCRGGSFPDGTTYTGYYCACLSKIEHYEWECR